MKKYTAKYYDKDGNLKGTKTFWAKDISKAEAAALKAMGEHHSFTLFYRGRWVINGSRGFCDVTKQDIKFITRKNESGFTLVVLRDNPLKMTPNQ
jgi:hypothetical protein